MQTPWYLLADADEAQVDSPALLVYRARVVENIRRMIAYVGGDPLRLRPHVKTHKMSAVTRLYAAAGVTKFKCATIAEAEATADGGGTDILLAHQPVGPRAARFARLVKSRPHVHFATIVDDAGALAALSAAAVQEGVECDVYLDVDVGMQRTGIPPGPAAVALYRKISQAPGLRPAGLHVYDGHLRDPDRAKRCADVAAAMAPVRALCDELTRGGLSVPNLVAGGTPTFPCHAASPDVECSPGTCIFWDANYRAALPDLDFLYAAVVLTRVISKPGPNLLCLDLGYKAIAAEKPLPRAELLNLPDSVQGGHSEEHLVVETPRAGEFSVGSAVYAVPGHVCPTCALYSEALVIDGGHIVERWEVSARNRRLTV